MEKVAILGVGQTAFEACKKDQTYADLVYEATTAALKDAELSIADIDNIVTVSNDFWDGRTISSMAVGDAAGAAFGEGKNISTVEGDGTVGAFYGLCRILSGAYQTTLVVAHSKGSESDGSLITNAFFDPITERPLGLDATSAAAMQAKVVCDERGLTPEDLAAVVVKNRAHGAKNPKAHLRQAVSLEEVMASPPLSSPIRRADACPVSDGAAAVILGKKKTAKAVWIEGVGLCADAPLGQRDLRQSRALRQAAAKAYGMAKIADPSREIDVIEVSEQFSYQEPLWLKELGFNKPERVNLSGGCLCAHAVIAAGLVRLIEAAGRIRAGEARRAVAHGQYGLCGQSQCVWVLGAS